MEQVFDSVHFDQLLHDNIFVLAYFSGKNCAVCHALKPKIGKLVGEAFPFVKIVEVSVNELPELAARFTVFTIPVILVFVDGREYIREARNISTFELLQKIDKITSLYHE
jgi:thioredoxin-like negative regulator of GroEL